MLSKVLLVTLREKLNNFVFLPGFGSPCSKMPLFMVSSLAFAVMAGVAQCHGRV